MASPRAGASRPSTSATMAARTTSGPTASAWPQSAAAYQATGLERMNAAASNNLVKGIYARFFSDRKTGTESLWLLAGLGVLGLAPLLWLL